jgi:hypothetical protein
MAMVRATKSKDPQVLAFEHRHTAERTLSGFMGIPSQQPPTHMHKNQLIFLLNQLLADHDFEGAALVLAPLYRLFSTESSLLFQCSAEVRRNAS